MLPGWALGCFLEVEVVCVFVTPFRSVYRLCLSLWFEMCATISWLKVCFHVFGCCFGFASLFASSDFGSVFRFCVWSCFGVLGVWVGFGCLREVGGECRGLG